MTNREWIDSMFQKVDKKLCVTHDKIGDWICSHLWLLCLVFGICVVIVIVCSVIVEETIAVLLIPIAPMWFAVTSVLVGEWLDKEHKE